MGVGHGSAALAKAMSQASRVPAALRDYAWKLFNEIQQSALLPIPARRLLLRTVGVDIHRSAVVCERVYLGSRQLSLGVDVFVNVGSFIDGSARVSIGDYTRMGPFVRILTGTHDYQNSVIRRRRREGTIARPVTIERGCWIGMGASIMPGITIAEGCVVAAGSLVLMSTGPNGLYAGVPAVRKRDLSTVDDDPSHDGHGR